MIDQIRKHLRRKADPIDLLHQLVPSGTRLKSLVHAGAHLAQERYKYESYGYKNIMWIEGSNRLYERMVEELAAHHGSAVHETRCALLTDQDNAQVELREFSNDGMSNSIFSPTDRLTARWPDVIETGTTETALSTTLDTLLEGTQFARECDLLVVDVQGAEMLVLQGADKTLANAEAVVCEVSTVPYYDGGALFDETAEFLRGYGFVPMAMPRRHGDMLFMR